MVAKPKLAFLIQHGPELRVFLYSGLAAQLSIFFEIVIISEIQDAILVNYCKEHKYKMRFYVPFGRLIGYQKLSSMSKIRLQYVNGNVYRHMGLARNTSRLKILILGNLLTYSLFVWLFCLVNYAPQRNALTGMLKQEKIKGLFMLTATSQFALHTVLTSKRLGIQTYIIQNSFKDYYVNPFIAPHVAVFFCWSKFYLNAYKRANKFNWSTLISASGFPPYQQMENYKPSYTYAHYAAKYNFSENEKIIYYTAINPSVYNQEGGIIRKIAEVLRKVEPSAILLVRKNPMDEITSVDWLSDLPNVRVQERMSIYVANKNHLIYPETDTVEYMDMLFYSQFVMNVPSTVTVEAMLLNKHILNICFDISGRYFDRFDWIYTSDFYQKLHGERVIPVKDIDQLAEIMIKLMGGEKDVYKDQNKNTWVEREPVNKIVSCLNNRFQVYPYRLWH